MKILMLASAIFVHCSTKSIGRGNERVAPGNCQRGCECPNGQVWSRSLEKCMSPFITDYYDYEDDYLFELRTPEPPTTIQSSEESVTLLEEGWSEWSPFSKCQLNGKKKRTRRLPDFDGNGRWIEEVQVEPCSLNN